jgi:HD-like signal output (HDOD) protein
MRVLFVDDEPRVLDGLRRLLRPKRDRWDMRFAASGAAALEALEGEPVDVLVTDMRMPGMDGARLLAQVRDRYPQIVRMILSGHSDRDASMRAVEVAHQFLNKPCDATTLTDTIERAVALHGRLDLEAMRRAIGQVDSLPSVPATWQALNERLADPDAAAHDVAEIVRGDVAMSAKLLQVANSSFLGLAQRLSSVEQAVVYLGVGSVRSLAMSLEVFRAFEPRGRLGSDFCDRLARHGAACASLTRRLVDDPADADHALTAALLQDAGQLLLASRLPETLQANLDAAAERGMALHVIEQEQGGFTHAEVGAYLFSLWGLPAMVVDAVAGHHDPLPPQGARIGPAEAVRLAHHLVQREQPADRDPTDVVPPPR